MAIGDFVTQMGSNFVDSVTTLLPGIVAAIVVILLGYVVGKIIGRIVKKIIVKLRIVEFISKELGMKTVLGRWDIPYFLALVIQWYVFVLFLSPAADVVSMPGIAAFLLTLALWIPNLIAALIVAFVGIVVAQYVERVIVETKAQGAPVVALVVKIVIIVMVALMAIKQTGVDVSLAEGSFLLIVAGIMLAFGISFGLGLQAEAQNIIKKLKTHL